MSSRVLSTQGLIVVMVMSFVILGAYLAMNAFLYPAYPVTTPSAETSQAFAEHYPPFRLSEWMHYAITREMVEGRLFDEGTVSRTGSIGYPALASLFVKRWEEKGMFFANAFILWASALVFFFLMLELIEYDLAMAATFVLALATPNLFFASSAFSEPTAQLLTVLSVFLFVKGMMAHREWFYYGLSGIAVGALIFVKPSMTFLVLLFAGLLINERGRFVLDDRNVLSLFGGFLVPVSAYAAIYWFLVGSLPILHSPPEYAYATAVQTSYGGNVITGLWSLLLDGPNGILFLMPVAALVPLGIIVMWRNEMHTVAIINGALLLYVIVITASSHCPVTGESIGSRQLLPMIPFLILPVAFLWREQAGEKIWLFAALVLTIYMSGFGWWTGNSRHTGLFTGALHDTDARAIILARKDMIGKPAFKTSDDLVDLYLISLKDRNLSLWLKCLDTEVITALKGKERTAFAELCAEALSKPPTAERFVVSVDPNKGIVPVLPSAYHSAEPSENEKNGDVRL